MTRLQKKCFVATAGFHLLLLVILIVGPAFFWARQKPDESPVLEMIPETVVDTASTSVQSPQPPPPAPPVVPQPPAPPQPEVVKSPVQPPVPDKITLVKHDPVPVEKPNPVPPQPKISLVPTTHIVPKPPVTSPKPAPDNSQEIKNVLEALRKNLSSKTTVVMPVGNDSAAAANYAQVVKSVYEQAWILPDDLDSDTANTKVKITISKDGTVVSAKIITPSGDAKLDASVQRTLERVKFIAPFPSGTSDTERTYNINFNPQIKRMLG